MLDSGFTSIFWVQLVDERPDSCLAAFNTSTADVPQFAQAGFLMESAAGGGLNRTACALNSPCLDLALCLGLMGGGGSGSL